MSCVSYFLEKDTRTSLSGLIKTVENGIIAIKKDDQIICLINRDLKTLKVVKNHREIAHFIKWAEDKNYKIIRRKTK